jgi:formate hydrogenlyase subunit 3/multisubunit Na+/H+ antiporter MnhD subunit
MSVLLPLSIVFPLLLAAALGCRPLRPVAVYLLPLAALPTLALTAFQGDTIEIPWLLLGTRLGVDETAVLFLLLTGLLWTASGVYAQGYLADDPGRVRFNAFYLLTFAGNLGVILAMDMASFYLFFALMTFAAYGLIVHDGSAAARRAGRLYLILGLIGEVSLLVAILALAAHLGNLDLRALKPLLATSPNRDWITGFILFGFAIKMGTIPLHVWLALAHPCAPTPASAVLSGIIIKAGLLGWLRFLPLGELALPSWSTVFLGLGLGSVFYGASVGLFQERPKTVLAYSSISQMGLLTLVLGIAFAAPEAWPLLLSTLLFFSLHHGLAKASLFLGVGMTDCGSRWAAWSLLLPALTLIGIPLTSGALAKLLLKDAALLTPGQWQEWLPVLLNLSAGATALLMIRFLYLAWPRGARGPLSAWLWLPYLTLLAAGLTLPWWWAETHLPGMSGKTLNPKLWIDSAWLLLASAILAMSAWGSWRSDGVYLRLPEGDILTLFARLAAWLPRTPFTATGSIKRPLSFKRFPRGWRLLRITEDRLQLWISIGTLFILLQAALLLLLARS